jgi:hypothetical protein
MPNWLWRSIVGVAGALTLVAILQWGACRFYVLPQVWPWYSKQSATGTEIDPALMGCNDIDARTVTVLMGVLTTLISLSRNADQ